MATIPTKLAQGLVRASLSPIFSGSLLVALYALPDATRQQISPWLSSSPSVRSILGTLLGIGVVRYINHALNALITKPWHSARTDAWDWPNEIAVITGGCSGIGYNVVERLVRRQVKVAILDIQDLPESFRSNPLIYFYQCDIASAEQVVATADAIRRDIGSPSILINNAGISAIKPMLELSQDYLRKMFDVNCLSHWTTVQQFLPQMLESNKGHIVTVASLASFFVLAKGAHYGASKAAVMAMHEALTDEIKTVYKSDGVLTTIVHPGFVRTPLIKDQLGAVEKTNNTVTLLNPDEVADDIVNQIFSKQGGQLILPPRTSFMSGFRGFPTWLQIIIRRAVNKKVGRT